MKNKKILIIVIFNIVSIPLTLLSLYVVLMFFFMRGFGGFTPLWPKLLGVFILLWIFAQYHIHEILFWLAERKISRAQLLSYLRNGIMVLIIFIIPVIVWHHISYQRYMQKIFKLFFSETYVKKVKLIEGNYFAWLDVSGHLTFKTEPHSFKEIAKDYEIVPKDRIISTWGVGRRFKDIISYPDITFLYKEKKLSNEAYDACYLAWDEKRQISYFQFESRVKAPEGEKGLNK